MIGLSRMSVQRWICLLFVAFIPLSWASFYVGSVYRSLTLILLMVFLLFMGWKYQMPRSNMSLCISWTLFVGYTMMTMLWAVNKTSAFYYCVGMALMYVIVLIFASTDWDTSNVRKMDAAWIAVGMICSLLYVLGGRVQVSKYGDRETLIILGTETDPNEFAGVLAIPIALGVRAFFLEKRLEKKVFHALLLMLELYVILLTGSRGALMAAAVSAIVSVLMLPKKSFGMVFGVGVLIFFVSTILTRYIIPLVPELVLDRLTLEALQESGGGGREMLWRNAVEEIRKSSLLRTLFGYGQDGIIVYGQTGRTGAMHNQFLQMFVNGGLVGVLLYIKLIWDVFVTLMKHNKRYVGGFAGMMILSMTLSLSAAYKPLWILMVMAFVRENKRENTAK